MTNQAKSTQPPVGIARTAAALALASGVTGKTVQNWKRMPGFPKRDDGGFNIWQVGEWYWSTGPGAAKLVVSSDDAMIGDSSTSPGLERFRVAKAGLAELDLAEKQKILIRRELVRDAFALVAGRLRQLGQSLATSPQDPAGLLADALDDIEREGSQFTEEPA